MATFCKCGSIILNDRCTNKNCAVKSGEPVKSAAQAAKKPKSTKTKRASKCITYNLYESKSEDTVI